MKRPFLLVLLSGLLAPLLAQVPVPFGFFANPSAAASASCTLWQENSNDTDFEAASTEFAQKISMTSDAVICQFTMRVYKNATDAVLHVEAWTTYDRTGSQLGSNSDSVSVTSTSTGNTVNFTWSGTKPSPTSGSEFYMHIVQESGDARFRIATVAGGTFYLDTTFAMYSPITVYGSGTYDFFFSIYKQ